MKRVSRQKYRKKLQQQAVQLVQDEELTLFETARLLAMSDKTRGHRVFREWYGQHATLEDSRRPVTELEVEVSRPHRTGQEFFSRPHFTKQAPRRRGRRQLPFTHKHHAGS